MYLSSNIASCVTVPEKKVAWKPVQHSVIYDLLNALTLHWLCQTDYNVDLGIPVQDGGPTAHQRQSSGQCSVYYLYVSMESSLQGSLNRTQHVRCPPLAWLKYSVYIYFYKSMLYPVNSTQILFFCWGGQEFVQGGTENLEIPISMHK